MEKIKLKAIFFDLDGVLVISEECHLFAWIETLKELNLPHDYLGLADIFGIGDDKVAKKIKKDFSLKQDIQELCHMKQNHFLGKCLIKLKRSKGRGDFLKAVHGKYLLAVVSSACRREVEAMLKHEDIYRYFDFLITREDVVKSKPDSEPYITAMKRANVSPNEAMAIEDSFVGLDAARASGVKVIGMATTINSYKDVHFVKDFDELLGKMDDLVLS
jgi:HAD superfamily hydrolase (TIGR01509 family)